MPSASGDFWNLVLRRTVLTPKEWLVIINQTVKMLLPHLDRITLSTLDQIKFLHGPEGLHSLTEDKFKHDIQGIFCFLPPDCRATANCQWRYFWGLTRRGQWELGTVESIKPREGKPYETATSVESECSSLEEILRISGITPFGIWKRLYVEVRQWRDKRYEQFLAADQLERDLAFRTQILERLG